MGNKKKIICVFGTRPEVIKMAPVIKSLQGADNLFEVLSLNTGQHGTMVDDMLSVFGIKPDINLALMKPGQSLEELTSRILEGVCGQIDLVQPDAVLVHGDTTTAMASALAAFYKKVDIGHVEAGLRTGDIRSPFPEEFNRKQIGLIAKYHFAATSRAQRSLVQEGVNQDDICVTGNTVIDALLWCIKDVENNSERLRATKDKIAKLCNIDLDKGDKFCLVTAHRRENHGRGIEDICAGLKSLAISNPTFQFVYPVHLNPKILGPVTTHLSGIENISLTEPLNYELFSLLLKYCHFILTDSGGLQEEAPAFKKPVLVMRDHSERPEAIEAGTAKIVGTNSSKIIKEAQKLIDLDGAYQEMQSAKNPYGDGLAAGRIREFLTKAMT